jgi:membrane associated rhomboid family serine protease
MFPIGDENQGKKGISLIVLALIVINVAVFLYEATLSEEKLLDFVTTYGVVPNEIENGQDLFTLITSMFVHGGWAHVGGNMLFLWIFGDNIERRFGPLLFTLLYLAWGLAASVAHILTNSGSMIPSVGASGAIAGVMGSYILLYPTNRVQVLIMRMGIVAVPAFVFLGIWFATQLINGVAALSVPTAQTSGVAVWAHVGGFVAGALAAVLLRAAPTGETA